MAETTNNQKKITIAEFKAWLEGLTEIQPDDWAPDQNQWKKIKAKIQNLEEFDTTFERQIIMTIERAVHKVRMPAPPQAWYPPNTVAPMVDNNPGHAQHAQPNQVHMQPVVMPPAGGSSLAGATAATPPLVPNLPNIPGMTQGNLDPRNALKIEATKTPDIDTTGGSYTSNFL